MSRDDFFEQLAHDHYPGPRAVYDGPDGTARRAPRPAPLRATRARNAHTDRTRRGGHALAAAALAGAALSAVAVSFLVTQDAEPNRDLAAAARLTPSQTLASSADNSRARARSGHGRASRPRRTPPRDAHASRTRRPRTRHHSPRPRSVRRVRRSTGTPRVAPAATPRAIPTAVATAPRAAPTPPRPTPPSPSRPASEPSCEFPPC